MFRDSSLVPLSHQHQHGLALSVIIDRSLKADPAAEKVAELSRKVATMAEVELLGHFKVEEDVLFPSVRAVLDDDGVVDELISQHRSMEDLVQRLADAQDVERVGILQEFGELLSRHIRLEERQLFQEIQAKLAPEELNRLGARIHANVQQVCPVTSSLPWDNADR